MLEEVADLAAPFALFAAGLEEMELFESDLIVFNGRSGLTLRAFRSLRVALEDLWREDRKRLRARKANKRQRR